MNHIHRLRHERDTACALLHARDAALRSFREHLASPKFHGLDHDGERKDWIATGDVLAWLSRIEPAEPDDTPDGDASVTKVCDDLLQWPCCRKRNVMEREKQSWTARHVTKVWSPRVV